MSRVRVTIYGGLNEIGGNKILLEDGEDRLFFDFGMSIGARNSFFDEYLKPRTNSMLRDLLRLGLLPDVDGIYREDLLEIARSSVDTDLPESAEKHISRQGRPFVHGVLLTHAHIDHYQDITFLDPRIPVFCSATTREMLRAIDDVSKTSSESEIVAVRERFLTETGERTTFPGLPDVDVRPVERRVETVPEGGTFRVGPFRVVAVPVDHSVPGACAFLVTTPSGKRVFYTGDVRFHGALGDRTKVLVDTAAGLKPDLLLTEGTRVDKGEAPENEAGVERDVTELVRTCRGLAIAEFGWKDTTRFETVQKAAAAAGRTLLVSAKLAYLLRKLDHLGPSRAVERYPNVKVYVRRRRSQLGQPHDYALNKHEAGYAVEWETKGMRAAWTAEDQVALRDPMAHFLRGVRAEDIRKDPGRYLLHLSFFESSELFDLVPPPGSRWIRCATEPFNDEMKLDHDRQKRWLSAFGLEHNVHTDTGIDAELNGTLKGTTHVSGHAAGSDLLPFVDSFEAALVAPIHTEAKNVACFEDRGLLVQTFPDFSFRDAAKGRAVFEI